MAMVEPFLSQRRDGRVVNLLDPDSDDQVDPHRRRASARRSAHTWLKLPGRRRPGPGHGGDDAADAAARRRPRGRPARHLCAWGRGARPARRARPRRRAGPCSTRRTATSPRPSTSPPSSSTERASDRSRQRPLGAAPGSAGRRDGVGGRRRRDATAGGTPRCMPGAWTAASRARSSWRDREIHRRPAVRRSRVRGGRRVGRSHGVDLAGRERRCSPGRPTSPTSPRTAGSR